MIIRVSHSFHRCLRSKAIHPKRSMRMSTKAAKAACMLDERIHQAVSVVHSASSLSVNTEIIRLSYSQRNTEVKSRRPSHLCISKRHLRLSSFSTHHLPALHPPRQPILPYHQAAEASQPDITPRKKNPKRDHRKALSSYIRPCEQSCTERLRPQWPQ